MSVVSDFVSGGEQINVLGFYKPLWWIASIPNSKNGRDTILRLGLRGDDIKY